ncbi:MAG: hypothetical protein DRJ49_01950 [Thermoprotei archaeon]|nr:MAG: hypothetical protein DRJ49_01950 [Thermoprotei archaeon]
MYYGYIPWNIYDYWRKDTPEGGFEYVLDETTIRDFGLLVVIGNYDNTKVRVFKLPENILVDSFTVDHMKYKVVKLPNATFFKVVTDKHATVMLMGGAALDTWPSNKTHERWINRAPISMFLMSVEGGYVGKTFIFLATLHTVPSDWPPGGCLRVYALEDSEVSLYDERGKLIKRFKLKANEVKGLIIKGYRIYKLSSTGYIMAALFFDWYPNLKVFPSANGRVAGTRFYIPTTPPGHYYPNATYVFTSTEDTKVIVYDLRLKVKVKEFLVKKGTINPIMLSSDKGDLVIESSKDLIVVHSDWTLGLGIAYIGLRRGETATIFIPSGETYLFSPRKATITIDGIPYTVMPDSYLPLPRGFHRISTNESVVIQIIQYQYPPYRSPHPRYDPLLGIPGTQGFGAFAAVIPSIKDVEVVYKIELKPLGMAEAISSQVMYAIALLIIVVLATILWKLKTRFLKKA